jgi:hypothetical protein
MSERGRMKLWMTVILLAVLALAVYVFMNYVSGIRGT